MKKVGLILLSVLLLTGMVLPVMADDDEDVYYLTMCSGSNLTMNRRRNVRIMRPNATASCRMN